MTYHNGEQIYKYELQSYIGGGAFGEVWLATDITLNSQCALKLLPRNDISIDERLLEAQIGNRLHHNNVVNIKYADIIQYGTPPKPVVTIAMPFYSHGSVLSQLNSNNFLDFKLTIKCLIDVLKGLEYLHENGYYHCDIKPNNILVGEFGEYILSDYGITCHSTTHTAVQPRQRYLPHTSPETISGNTYDERTDIYQLGLTAFRLINGISEIKNDFLANRTVFQERVLQGKVVTDAKYQPFVPRKIRRIISKAIALNPADRYQTALDMRRALEQLSLAGTCTADANGNIIFRNNGYSYRYEIQSLTAKTSNFIVYKKSDRTGRETRATKYCVQNIKNSDLPKRILALSTDLI